MEHTADTPNVKRLERPTSGRMVMGVCAGLGRYFDLSPTFYRLGFVVLTLLGGTGILLYIAAVLVVPEEGKENSIAAAALAGRREKPWPLAGIALVGIALAVLLARATLRPFAGGGWVLLLIVGLGVLWASRSDSPGRRFFRAIAVVVATLLAAAIAAVAIAFAWFDVNPSNGMGDRIYQPAGVAELRPAYKLGVGNLRVDLRNIGPVTHDTTVHASLGIGNMRITVPAGTSIAVNAHAKLGEVDVLQQHQGGRNATISIGGGGHLVIDARVGAGRIEVERAVP